MSSIHKKESLMSRSDEPEQIRAIVDVDYRTKYGERGPMVIPAREADTNKHIELRYDGKLMLFPGDILNIKVEKHSSGKYYRIVGFPLVQIPITKDNFLVIFDRWKRFLWKKLKCSTNSEIFYTKSLEILKRARNDPNLAPSYSSVGDLFDHNPDTPIAEIMYILYKRNNWESNPYPPDMISTGQLNGFVSFWNKHVVYRRLYLFGVTDEMVAESGYSPEVLYRRIVKNPFTVACIPMETAKDIFRSIDRPYTRTERYCGWALREITENQKNGHSYTPQAWLDKTHNLTKYLDDLRQDYDVILDNGGYYLKHTLYIENEIARFLRYQALGHPYVFNKRGRESKDTVIFGSEENTAKESAEGEEITTEQSVEDSTDPILMQSAEDLPVNYPENLSDDQKNAIELALSRKHALSCVTGKAGSGKTTTLRTMVHNLQRWGMVFGIFTFTGAASSRANTVLEQDISRTFHRSFQSSNPDYDYVIVDEASMVNAELFYLFLSRNPTEKKRKYIFVGDWNQLPPIGWGRIFQDIIHSEHFPVYVLTGNHRASPFPGKPDGIVPNAESVLGGDYCYVDSENFYYSQGGKKDMLKYYKQLHKLGVSPEDIALICAFRKYGSVEYFNNQIREIFRSSEEYIEDQDKKRWYLGDMVISVVNNYDIGVMNGQRGRVSHIDEEEIEVTYKGIGENRVVTYNTVYEVYREKVTGFEKNSRGTEATTRDIELGYAFTVHKSQGNEYLYSGVYYDLEAKISKFLSRNLTYTAITRAKTSCKVIGPENILEESSRIGLPRVRTRLLSKLKGLPKIPRTFQLEDEYPMDDDF